MTDWAKLERKEIKEQMRVEHQNLMGNLLRHAMRTNSEQINIQVPIGWTKLVDRLHEAIKDIKNDYAINRIEERFGILRFNVGIVEDQTERKSISTLVDIAEKTSTEVCQDCGEPGCIRDYGGMTKTLCDQDYQIWRQMITRYGESTNKYGTNISLWDDDLREYWNL